MPRQSRGMDRNADRANEGSKQSVSEIPKKRTRSASRFLKYPGEESPGERLPKQKLKKCKTSGKADVEKSLVKKEDDLNAS